MLLRINTEDENVGHTDAAAHLKNDRFAISVVGERNTELNAVSIRAKDMSTPEELGIALAIITCKKTFVTVVTDSRETKQRRHYPPAHKKLNRQQAMTSRRIQVRTYQPGTLLHAMYPGAYGPDYKFWPPDTPNTVSHTVLGCKDNPYIPSAKPPTDTTRLNEAANSVEQAIEDKCEALMLTQDLRKQLWFVDRARADGASHGYLD
ncbi:hypothetical protein HPB50_013300 [Hyalomma asiaticum]|uniref:Uncharacterized protein n=1 Tax=Hyalomma asiaticum TaxID=266040 RepID=A0ACB7T9Q4_HYAAI|nr:hypothetical protein HPB50_013300 [Hyalomma asiaticum]